MTDRELEIARSRMGLTIASYTGRPCERLAGPCEGCDENDCATCPLAPTIGPGEPGRVQDGESEASRR